MKKLRLVLFEECNRTCPYCVNNDYDVPNLPVCKDLYGYDEYILTGGEPMLKPDLVQVVAKKIRRESNAPIFVYTAKVDNLFHTINVLTHLQGLTLTLHARKDLTPALALQSMLKTLGINKALRIKAPSTIPLDGIDPTFWEIRHGVQWVKNCPLPPGEVLMQYKQGELNV